MRIKSGLRIRTIVAHMTLGVALSASLATAVTLLLEDLEERYLRVTMLESLDLLVQIGRHQEQPELPATESLKAYVLTPDGDTTLPEELLGLGPGIHDLDTSEEELLVAVRDDGSRRYVLTYDETPIVRLETYFTIGGLILGIVGFTFAALWLGSWMSGRVLKPVISLARQINAIGDEVSRPLLRGSWGTTRSEISRVPSSTTRIASAGSSSASVPLPPMSATSCATPSCPRRAPWSCSSTSLILLR